MRDSAVGAAGAEPAESPCKSCKRNGRGWRVRIRQHIRTGSDIPDEAAAQGDYQVIKDAHTRSVVGSYDAAVVTKDASGKVHENKDETATRKGAW